MKKGQIYPYCGMSKGPRYATQHQAEASASQWLKREYHITYCDKCMGWHCQYENPEHLRQRVDYSGIKHL